jgi:hypothetical protein
MDAEAPSFARIATLESLREHLQWAIKLEHFTLPPYLECDRSDGRCSVHRLMGLHYLPCGCLIIGTERTMESLLQPYPIIDKL